MREIILIACLVACCHAAPASQQQTSNEHKQQSMLLNRPSPINPDIPSDPKPEEKIIMITDPKEIVKHKREIGDDPYDHISRFAPTLAPTKQVEKDHSQETQEKHSAEAHSEHHRQKREQAGHILDAKKPAKAPAIKPTPPPRKAEVQKEKSKQTRRHNVPASVAPAAVHDLPKPRQRRQVDPHLIGASTVGFAPTIINDDEEQKVEEAEEKHDNSHKEPQVAEPQQQESQVQAESAGTQETAPAKRDIPVPLVPKYHHPEESPKSGENSHKTNGQTPNKSSESDESDENSKEKKPLASVQTHQPVQPVIANNNHQQISTQPLLLDGPVVHEQSLGRPGSTQNHPSVQPAVHSQIANNNLPQISTQPLVVDGPNTEPVAHDKPLTEQENPAAAHETSVVEPENKPLGDQLATIKPTQIIAYETPAHDDHLAIKHPLPVAELFSRPKQ